MCELGKASQAELLTRVRGLLVKEKETAKRVQKDGERGDGSLEGGKLSIHRPTCTVLPPFSEKFESLKEEITHRCTLSR